MPALSPPGRSHADGTAGAEVRRGAAIGSVPELLSLALVALALLALAAVSRQRAQQGPRA